MSAFATAQIPADPDEVREALEEGVKIIDATQVIAFRAANGSLSHLECRRTVAGAPDARGIAWPVLDPDQPATQLAFERAFVAIGQVGSLTSASFGGHIAISERGFIETDAALRISFLGQQ